VEDDMGLSVGQAVGDFTFARPDGTPLALSAFAGRPLVLIFLRHLA
jgi:peroxiredoxin